MQRARRLRQARVRRRQAPSSPPSSSTVLALPLRVPARGAASGRPRHRRDRRALEDSASSTTRSSSSPPTTAPSTASTGCPGGKGLAYEEAAHMPLAIRVPPKYRGGDPVVREIDEPTVEHRPARRRSSTRRAPRPASRGRRVPGDGRALAGRPAARWRRRRWPANRPLAARARPQRQGARTSGAGSHAGTRASATALAVHRATPSVPTPGLGVCASRRRRGRALRPAADPVRARQPRRRRPRARTTEAVAAAPVRRSPTELADCAGIKGRDPEPASGHYCS